jgi:hypothetical protein
MVNNEKIIDLTPIVNLVNLIYKEIDFNKDFDQEVLLLTNIELQAGINACLRTNPRVIYGDQNNVHIRVTRNDA